MTPADNPSPHSSHSETPQKWAFLFPGQGSQCVGMAKDLCQEFAVARLVFEEASDATHLDLKRLCFEGPLDELTRTSHLQPALLATEVAFFRALYQESGWSPQIVAGHSLGEYAALVAAESISLSRGAFLTAKRGEAMDHAGRDASTPSETPSHGESRLTPEAQKKTGMIALLGASLSAVEQACRQERGAAIANDNATGQVVLAGYLDALERVSAAIKSQPESRRIKAIPLAVSAPFHCWLMEPARQSMAPLLRESSWTPPKWQLLHNWHAQTCTSTAEIPALMADQITGRVRWRETMDALGTSGITHVLELGPGQVLTGLWKRTFPDKPSLSVHNVDILKQALHLYQKS